MTKQNEKRGDDIKQESSEQDAPRQDKEKSQQVGTYVWMRDGLAAGRASRAKDDRSFVQKTILLSLFLVVLLSIVGVAAYRSSDAIRAGYASRLMEAGRYGAAERTIRDIQNAHEQETMLQKCYYACAKAYLAQGQTAQAEALFAALDSYLDAESQRDICAYERAKISEAEGDYADAADLYDAAASVADAEERANECRYAYALERFEYGFFDEAMRLFYALGDFREAEDYARLSASALVGDESAGDLVDILAGLSDEALLARETLCAVRESLPTGWLATGYFHTVALTQSGEVLACGSNAYGQCQTTEWSGVRSVAAGAYHTVALREDGTVYACGRNDEGQCDVSWWRNVVRIYAGSYETIGVLDTGEIYIAGYRSYRLRGWGEAGVIRVGAYALTGVTGGGRPLSTNASLYDERYYDLVDLCAATVNSVGLRADGSVVSNAMELGAWEDVAAIACTANGVFALCADGHVEADFFRTSDTIDVSSWRDIVAISASATHVAAITRDGSVVAAGRNTEGQCETKDWRITNRQDGDS